MTKKEKLHGEETLLYVYYNHARYAASEAHPNGDPDRMLRRGLIGADLGLSKDPKFTDAEMQKILFAAKMAAIKCLMERK